MTRDNSNYLLQINESLFIDPFLNMTIKKQSLLNLILIKTMSSNSGYIELKLQL